MLSQFQLRMPPLEMDDEEDHPDLVVIKNLGHYVPARTENTLKFNSDPGEHTTSNKHMVIENGEEDFTQTHIFETVEHRRLSDDESDTEFPLDIVKNEVTEYEAYNEDNISSIEVKVEVEDGIIETENEIQAAKTSQNEREWKTGKSTKVFSCDHCEFSTNTKYNLSQHEYRIHSHIVKNQYKCEECDFTTARKIHLRIHNKSFHGKNKQDEEISECDTKAEMYGCDECSFITTTKSQLKCHVKTVHKEYQCPQCSYSSTKKWSVNFHAKRVHPTENIYKCADCSFTSTEKYILKKHIKMSHTDQAKFKCDICQYVTHSKQALRSHYDCVHLERKEFICEKCPYASHRKINLKCHMKTQHKNGL